ncbi:hypothetical protein [Methylobacterium sp. 174MFSha1.1]|nr:hypothetical protein [Methylobacterium sp. 174MFSha1.1]
MDRPVTRAPPDRADVGAKEKIPARSKIRRSTKAHADRIMP